MDEGDFQESSRAIWERLSRAVAEARDSGVESLDVARLRGMHDDYRRSAADLAYAQTHFPGSTTTAYLDRLVGQAHAELYGSRPGRLRVLWRFLAHGYPALVRSHAGPMAAAAGLTLGFAAAGAFLAYADWGVASLLVPPVFRDAVGNGGGPGGLGDAQTALAPLLSAAITVNNLQVSFTAFAGGVTFGLLTAYVLVRNALLLGVLAGAYAQAGLSLEFWSLIAPHGALELPAILIAGGSGFVMGRALLFPGDAKRLEALKPAAQDAVRIVLGSIPLFVIAGLVEGFVTPLAVDPSAKIAFGAIALLALGLYLGLGGRRAAREDEG